LQACTSSVHRILSWTLYRASSHHLSALIGTRGRRTAGSTSCCALVPEGPLAPAADDRQLLDVIMCLRCLMQRSTMNRIWPTWTSPYAIWITSCIQAPQGKKP
jgi:hypothetical protein